MTLPSPIIDDRSYAQLSEELRRRIPVYAPEWTDHNPSDPGIALLELFAYLGENLLFRFNQIPETTQMAFLRLLDIPLHPARPATGIVTFEGAGPIPAGTEVRAGKLPFETQDEVTALALEVRAVGRVTSRPPEDLDDIDRVQPLLSARGISSAEAAYYRVQAVDPDASAPDAVAVDLATTVDRTVWVAVLGAEGGAPAAQRLALAGQVLNLGIVLDEQTAEGLAGSLRSPGTGAAAPSPPAFEWQVTTGAVVDGEPVHRTVATVADATRGFTTGGVVRIELPAGPIGVPPAPDPDLAGTGHHPPVLDDPDEQARVLCWLRGFRPVPGPALPRLRWLGANAARVAQRRTAPAEYLGRGTGATDQRYRLAHVPVLAGSVTLEVEEAGRWVGYRQVEQFATSAADDRHYMIDLASGTVRFGGRRGRRPQPEERIRVRSYQHGGGTEGNVGAGSISKVDLSVKVTNPFPTSGGEATESIASALERIPGEFRRRDRAVAASDFRELALQAPGVSLARAEVLPRFQPITRTPDTPGVVCVLVWPASDPDNPNRPTPRQSDLDAVCAHLDQRRLVTTELYVAPPTYRSVAVSVGISVEPGHHVQAVRRWVELAIRQYLAPVPPFGPSGGGWPLGRRVHGPELEAAALQVQGVAFLEDLLLAEQDASGAWVATPTVTLQRWEVVHLAAIAVVEGTALPPGDQPVPDEPTGTPIPIPLPPAQECS